MAKKKYKYIFFLLILLFHSFLFSQENKKTGSIEGNVTSALTGKSAIGVYVIVQVNGKPKYSATDSKGYYLLSDLPVGTQTVLFQGGGYLKEEKQITIVDGKTKRLNSALEFEVQGRTVIRGKKKKNTVAATLTERKKSAVAQDAISAEAISKSTDGDAASAAKRVTGVSIFDGGNVFIRGLGERYSAVMFDNVVLPSPNPEKKVVSLDIFPVSLLDNLTVVKTYNSDFPAEFGGGIVNIISKDYPEERIFNISLGTGFHSLTTMGQQFKTYEGGSLDWLGIDDGTRALPSGIRQSDEAGKIVSNVVSAKNYDSDEIEEIGEGFKNTYTPTSEDAFFLNSGKIAMSFGDSYKLGTQKLGFFLSGAFSGKLENRTVEYLRVNNNFNVSKDLTFERTKYTTDKSALLTFFYAPLSKHTFKATSFYVHESSDLAQEQMGHDNEYPGEDNVKEYKLQFINTGLFFNQLQGNHEFSKTKVKWGAVYGLANRYEPDTRIVNLVDENGTGDFYLNETTDINRSFQQHADNLYAFYLNGNIPFKQWAGLQSSLKIGLDWNYRFRNASSRNFRWFNGANGGSPESSGEPLEDLFNEDSIVGSIADAPTLDNFFIKEVSSQADYYLGNLLLIASYFNLDLPLTKTLSVIVGLRYEYSDMNIITYDVFSSTYKDSEREPLTPHNFLPSLNAKWGFAKNMNLRLAASQTITRPEFREVTEFKYTALSSLDIIQGNTNLVQTDIRHADLRYEWFMSTSEVFAVSLFYKYLEKPIELLEVPTSGTLYQFVNAEYAHNYGLELEVNKDFGFIHSLLSRFSFSGNFAYIFSQVHVNNDTYEYTSQDRPLQGQAPWIINANLGYESKNNFTMNVLYNVNGERIKRVGLVASDIPNQDVYQESSGSLDVAVKKKFKWGGSVKLSAKNLLDPEIQETQIKENSQTGEEKEFVLQSYKKGWSVGLSYSQKL